jgi:hypothetical protein
MLIVQPGTAGVIGATRRSAMRDMYDIEAAVDELDDDTEITEPDDDEYPMADLADETDEATEGSGAPDEDEPEG